jgi:outer membrane protein assembly factor BamB
MGNLDQETKYLLAYYDFLIPESKEYDAALQRLKNRNGLLWKNDLGGNPEFIQSDSLIYIRGASYKEGDYSRLLALDIHSGKSTWQEPIYGKLDLNISHGGGKYRWRVAQDNNNLYFISNYKSRVHSYFLRSVDKLTGEKNWSRDEYFKYKNYTNICSASVYDSLLCVIISGDDKSRITAYRTSNGNPLWKKDFNADLTHKAILTEKHAIVGINDTLYFINPVIGKIDWMHILVDSGKVLRLTEAGLQGDKFVFTNSRNEFVCIDITRKKEIWRTNAPYEESGYIPAVRFMNGDTLYDWTRKNLFAFVLDETTPNVSKMIWQKSVEDVSIYEPIFIDNNIFGISSRGKLLKIDQKTGIIEKNYHLLWGSDKYIKDYLIHDDTAYISAGGKAYAIRLE